MILFFLQVKELNDYIQIRKFLDIIFECRREVWK